jgi:hypothetical protein
MLSPKENAVAQNIDRAPRIGWKNTLAFSGYTDTFKLHRKNIAKVAGSSVSLQVFDRVQEEEAAHFLLNVLDSPENLFDHIKKEAGAVILKIIYGYTANAHGKDPFVDMAGRTMHAFAEATVPGKWAVDIMPFCKYTQADAQTGSDTTSEICTGLDAWNRFQGHSSSNGCSIKANYGAAIRVRQAANA